MKYKSCRICLAGKDAYRMANGCTQSTFELHLSCPFCHPKNKTESTEQAEMREEDLRETRISAQCGN